MPRKHTPCEAEAERMTLQRQTLPSKSSYERDGFALSQSLLHLSAEKSGKNADHDY